MEGRDYPCCVQVMFGAVLLMSAIELIFFSEIQECSRSLCGASMQAVINDIVNYVKDDSLSAKFAIVLYGEWGSGKTFFCEGKLKDELKANGLSLCRVSLFGVKTIEDIQERLLASYFHLDNAKADVAGNALGRSLEAMLEKIGIKIDVKPETVLSFVDMKKTLVVFDDLERSFFSANDSSLLGFVNDLVENRHWHVMLVRNEQVSLSENVSEKVISRQYCFKPNVEEVVEAVVPLKKILAWDYSFPATDSLKKAVKESGHLNARALARIVPLLDIVSMAFISLKGNYATDEMRDAFEEIVEFSLKAASGNPPVPPVKDGDDGSNWLENGHAALEYKKYQPLENMVNPIAAGSFPTKEAVFSCINCFMESFHSNSPGDLAMSRICECFKNVAYMDDEEVKSLAAEYVQTVRQGAFSEKWIYQGWKAGCSLRKLGFLEHMRVQEVKSCFEKVIKRNPSAAYSRLKKEYVLWKGMGGTDKDETVDALVGYAQKLADEEGSPDSFAGLNLMGIRSDTGKMLAERLNRNMDESYPVVHVSSGRLVAESFLKGNAESQMELHSFFGGVLPAKDYLYKGREIYLLDWLREIKSCLPDSLPDSRMGSIRLGWFKKDIDALIKDFDERAAK